ncbi:hypothetical protein [Paraburkholderia sp. RL17-373-BIF-A]|uniref:hypothetical protein n=1 Tax=Paraburkholderia sp. RL17-373-BIF-A TaxID=3031629 RepID=UPI0038B6C1B8
MQRFAAGDSLDSLTAHRSEYRTILAPAGKYRYCVNNDEGDTETCIHIDAGVSVSISDEARRRLANEQRIEQPDTPVKPP